MQVLYDFLEACAEKNACMSLSDETKKMHAPVIAWKGRLWVCVGSTSRDHRTLEANLIECVLEADYRGAARDPEARGEHYYTGARFESKGTVYVITDRHVTLEPIPEGRASNLYRA